MSDINEPRGYRWPVNIGWFLRPPEAVTTTLATAALVGCLFLLTVACLALSSLLLDLLSGDQRRIAEAAKTTLPLLAGAVGLPLIIWRLRLLDRQTRISEEKTQIDRETHYTSIFSRGIEQLGQTREVKSKENNETGQTESVVTAPNIEVRLGGIHSLSRLAEESLRDRSKIEKILRAYIRENSWIDRGGQRTQRLIWPTDSIWRLRHEGDTTEGLDAIMKRHKDRTKRISSWSSDLPETRVDVNEAADAVEFQQSLSAIPEDKALLYECLFVGRTFSNAFLSHIRFERCCFINCTLNVSDTTGVHITGSQIIRSRIIGEDSNVVLRGCRVSETTFSKMDRANISLTSSEIHSLTLHGDPNVVELRSSNIYNSYIYGENQTDNSTATTLLLSYSNLFECVFSMLKISVESDFSFLLLNASKLWSVDLTNLSTTFEQVEKFDADSGTKHPESRPRPQSWPAYDPENADIPF